MKTASIAGALALAGTIITAACTFATNPTESTFEDGGAGGGGATDAGSTGETGAHVIPPGQPAELPPAETLATFTAPEVTSIVEVINLGEITQGMLVQQQGTNPEVKAYAQRMVEDHGQAQQRIQKLLGPQATSEAQQTRLLRDPTASILLHQDQVLSNDLKTQTGSAFDLAYMTGQITAHAKVIALIDRALLPSALAAQTQTTNQAGAQGTGGAQGTTGGAQGTTGPGTTGGTQGTTGGAQPMTTELQAELKTMRASVAKHLVDALRIQKALRGTPAATPSASPSGPAASNP